MGQPRVAFWAMLSCLLSVGAFARRPLSEGDTGVRHLLQSVPGAPFSLGQCVGPWIPFNDSFSSTGLLNKLTVLPNVATDQYPFIIPNNPDTSLTTFGVLGFELFFKGALVKNAHAPAHFHLNTCEAADKGGAHWQFDKDAPPNTEANELWWTLQFNGDGKATVLNQRPYIGPNDGSKGVLKTSGATQDNRPYSAIIHDPFAPAGTPPAKVLCCDLTWYQGAPGTVPNPLPVTTPKPTPSPTLANGAVPGGKASNGQCQAPNPNACFNSNGSNKFCCGGATPSCCGEGCCANGQCCYSPQGAATCCRSGTNCNKDGTCS